MTSKLRRTIVGVGIALGGAAPACFGRTDVADLSPVEESDDSTLPDIADAPAPDARANDSGPPVRPSDASPADAGPSDAAVDASNDAADPFCDVAWPPTKGGPYPPNAPCVDPLNACKNVEPPRGCYRLIAPDVCSYDRTWEGPLYCIEGEWRCPPGTEDGPRCVCFGPLSPGQTCTDAGVSGP